MPDEKAKEEGMPQSVGKKDEGDNTLLGLAGGRSGGLIPVYSEVKTGNPDSGDNFRKKGASGMEEILGGCNYPHTKHED